MKQSALLAAGVWFALAAPAQNPLTDRITAASLEGRVSFLASDVLEGRDTPSRGLDIAADYIAAEFRSAHLESPSGSDYFQLADFLHVVEPSPSRQFSLSRAGAPPVNVLPDRITVLSLHGIRLNSEPIFKWAPSVHINGSLSGQILMLRAPDDQSTIAKLAFAGPDAIVELVRLPADGDLQPRRLIPAGTDDSSRPVIITVPETDVEGPFDRLANGPTNARASLNIAPAVTHPVQLRNVAGLLRGSDPRLRDECIIVSAHYDHLGVTSGAGESRIYNGANDDASGVATVIELAHAFAAETTRPKRSLLFLCFFGEEEGLLGSGYYVHHPLIPLNRTVADVNFEQLGRPDKPEGLPPGSLGVTGAKYSDLPQIMGEASRTAGARLEANTRSDEYFGRSDNLSFAEAGIPAHTFLAAFDFPDYHTTGDKWRKLDYTNMATIDRGLALGILSLANRPDPPHWNESNRKAKEFVAAFHNLHR